MKQQSTEIGEFSENVIKKYLDDKVYEKRGWTKEYYIEECKKAWNKTIYKPEYERKVIVDFSEPLTVTQLFGIEENEIDFVDKAITTLPVHGFENKKNIECLVFLAAKKPNEKGEMHQVKIRDAFKPVDADVFEKESSEQSLYLVALFDVLGFSNLVLEKGSKAILDTYQELMNLTVLSKNYTAFERIKVGFNNYVMGGTYTPIKYSYFSDTIILWTTNNATHVSSFLAKCADLICEALKIGMPLRGSICFGEGILNKSTNTIVGGALVEASNIEKNQKWIGATLGETFVLQELKDVMSETLVVPLFCEHYKDEMKVAFPYLTLDWITRWKEKKFPDIISVLEKLKSIAPEKNKIYYDNTINFVKYTELDDVHSRAIFLRTTTYRIKNLEEFDLHRLHMQPVILKVKKEIPHCGFVLTFPEELIRRNKSFKAFIKDNIIFVNRLYRKEMIDFFSTLGEKQLNLGDAGFIQQVSKKHVEYIDMFHYDEKKYDKTDTKNKKND